MLSQRPPASTRSSLPSALRSTLLPLALLAAAPAVAQETETRVAPAPSYLSKVTFDGVVGLGSSTDNHGAAIGFADVTFGLPLLRRLPLRFEVGTYLFALDGKRPHETYAAFAWNDRLRLGALRPAYDAVLPSVFETSAPYLAYRRSEYTRSHNTVEAMRRTAVPWGLSYTGASGRLDWIVSLHDARKGDFSTASAALTYSGAGWQAMAAVERVDAGGTRHTGFNAKLGARVTSGILDFGLAYLHPDANRRPDALAIDAAFAASARITLGLMGEVTEDGSDDAYGLSMDYGFRVKGQDVHLTLAATDGVLGRGAHLGVRYHF
jgi:hypothetical protein